MMAVAQLAVCFVLLLCISGNGQTRPSELVGKWEEVIGNPEFSDYRNYLELFKDGTGVLKDGTGNYNETISWKVENKRFVMLILSSSERITSNYKVSGYALTLTDDKGNDQIFVKEGRWKEYYALKEAEKAKEIAEAKLALEQSLEQLPKFTDSRDNKVYRKVKIGGKTWMAENLNYATNSSGCYEGEGCEVFSMCYDEKEVYCALYGRLYTWSAAKTACPTGWHLPSDAEWTMLTDFVGGEGIAGKKLKSTSGWGDYEGKSGNGTNEYLFLALPGGGPGDEGYGGEGYYGSWWTATMDGENNPYPWIREMSYYGGGVGRVGWWGGVSSVRCVQD
jgi:uncharacterized protein (TIGR02145 family)